jgi:hypothetical protein
MAELTEIGFVGGTATAKDGAKWQIQSVVAVIF